MYNTRASENGTANAEDENEAAAKEPQSRTFAEIRSFRVASEVVGKTSNEVL